jgi:peptidoglycan/xylan/chitin deacetylase (PgdA/CDA1 family)
VTGFRVALTFDAEHPDRPHRAGTPVALLDELEGADVRATFFLQGRWVESEPILARRICDAGHLVGSHCHYHVRMNLLSSAGFAADVRAAETAIATRLHVSPRPWLRFPFGAGADDVGLVDRLARLGYRHVGWHVEPKEWRTASSAPGVTRAIVDGALAHGDGAIVLLHTWPRAVPRAVRQAIAELRSAGAEFVRLDRLGLPAGLSPIAEPAPGTA